MYKPQREMKNKKLERLDGKLFEKLSESNSNINLQNIIGGVVISTKGTMNCSVGNKIYEKSYTDKQDVSFDKDGKIISGGCLYDIVFLNRPVITITEIENLSENIQDNVSF